MLLTLAGFVVSGFVFLALWWAYGRLLLSQGPKGQSLRRRLPFWPRGGSADLKYELLDRSLEDKREV